MKYMMWSPTAVGATPQEREQLRPIGRNADRYHALVEELEGLAVLADDHGFDAFGTTEHHFASEGGESMPNGLLLYAKLAARTKRLMFVPISIVLPAHDPIRVAEDIALFDQMYPGRIGVAFARGYSPRWMPTLMGQDNAMATPMDPASDNLNREIFDEYLEVVLKAWTEDSLRFEGKHYQVPRPLSGESGWPQTQWTGTYGAPGELDADGRITSISVVPKPLTQPHPPLFVPLTMSRRTLVDAAQRGTTVLVYDGRPDVFRQAAADYREEAAKAGRPLRLGEGVGAARKIVLGDTFEEAMDLAVRTVGFWYNRYFSHFGFGEVNRTEGDDPNKMIMFSSDRDCAERMYKTGQLLCGTTDDVTRQLEALHSCHADGELDWLAWEFQTQGTCTMDEHKRQLDLFADKVMPRFA